MSSWYTGPFPGSSKPPRRGEWQGVAVPVHMHILPDPQPQVREWHLVRGRWRAVDPYARWHPIPVLAIEAMRSVGMAPDRLRSEES